MSPSETGGRSDSASDRLKRYREKRSASATSEPFGGGARSGRGRLFVVQKHRASSLHWDLRLEMDGVLVSWAVPKGPSPNQADKRLAVHVEDHPLEYADFEGVVPAGSYGAGPSIVWDRGVWTAVEDPVEGMRAGKLLFDLAGHKLRGRWTLVRTKGGAANHWLLIKERDAHEDAEGGTDGYPDDSILSGLTVDQLGAGGDFGAPVRAMCRAAGARPAAVSARSVRAMQAEAADEPFSREGWVFEVKYDGYRALGERADGGVRMLSRNRVDLAPVFPEVAAALERLPYGALLLDGELVVNDASGLPSFRRIQRRGQLRRRTDVERAAAETPAMWYAFDILAFEGFDLRPLPLLARKEILRRVLPTVGPIRYSEHVPERGEALFERIAGLGLEGVVGKRADSIYVGGRSASWLKVRVVRTADFAVLGFTEPADAGDGFGALHLGHFDGDGFAYSGKVGSGFSEDERREIRRTLESLPPAPPPAGAPTGPAQRWAAPDLVAEVRYKDVTASGNLRHPSFLRLRRDKGPEECGPPDAGSRPVELEETVVEESRPEVRVTNPEKAFWPEDGYTKLDLVNYYREISPWILPHLADRPVVLTRYPDGIEGKSFFQKNAPDFAPKWVRRVRLYSEGSERDLNHFVADDVETLLYLANSAAIPLHVWQSRVSHLAQPDFLVLDLDPKDAPFADVVAIARFLNELCDDLELPSFVKTSGSTGLHVAVPLGRRVNYEQSRSVAQLLALVTVRELGEIATVARRPSQRDGKVYVDYLQNGHGRLIAAPYCVRPKAGAPVATPLEWSEVDESLRIGDHTIATVPERMKSRPDPMRDLLRLEPDLPAALERLQTRLAR